MRANHGRGLSAVVPVRRVVGGGGRGCRRDVCPVWPRRYHRLVSRAVDGGGNCMRVQCGGAALSHAVSGVSLAALGVKA
jgi:hypothetical protein